MTKDRRYNTLKKLFDSNNIKTLDEILEIIPITVISKDLKIHYLRGVAKFKDPNKFSIKEMRGLSKLIDIDSRKVYDVIAAGLDKKPAKKA